MSSESNLVVALRDAVDALGTAKVPASLREIAFAKALDYLLGGVQPPVRAATAELGSTGGPPSPEQDGPLAQVAAKLRVGSGIVERVFQVDGDGVHLGIARKALASSKKAATQEVAYLIAASRQALGLDEITMSSAIREACEHLGVLDGHNFGAAIAELQGQGFIIKGSGKSRELKINQVGYEKASEIVSRITDEAAK